MATGDDFAILKFARSRRKPPGVVPAEVVPKAEDEACRIVFDLGRLVGEGKGSAACTPTPRGRIRIPCRRGRRKALPDGER